MDKGARESLVNFENGVGDAAITYENEVLEAQRNGKPLEYVIPKATLQIENPVAVVERYAGKHGSTEAANAFVAFLTDPATQKSFGDYGYRPVVDGVQSSTTFPAVEHVFTIADLGGWAALQEKVFAADALYDRALAQARP
jgi:sulfate transport system substrate-binding protein